jgi:hypothetical protein
MYENTGQIDLEAVAITSGTIEASKIDFLVLWRGQYVLMSQLGERDRIWCRAAMELEAKLDEEFKERDSKASFWERLGVFFWGPDN